MILYPLRASRTASPFGIQCQISADLFPFFPSSPPPTDCVFEVGQQKCFRSPRKVSNEIEELSNGCQVICAIMVVSKEKKALAENLPALRLSKNPSGRFGGPQPSKCNPNPATCAADSQALRSKVSLHCFPPGRLIEPRGKQCKYSEKDAAGGLFRHAER